ncbi:MAG: class I SAM-dependent methyltransferase [Syntrophorhabdaceae bacterium]|nr:class I SAM-dependent methyltransferase [Syntrophorhabdaceae bacterium]
MADYLDVVYSQKERPYTDYPARLCLHLFHRFRMAPGMAFLEAGCGRGEFLKVFRDLGLNACGVDISRKAPEFNPDIPVKVSDIEREGIPHGDNTFDIVYSKSVLEHFREPERYMEEAVRVLRPGGMLITLVPDWESCYKIYFDDHTHRSPFSLVSLGDIYKMHGLVDIDVFKFRQLPLVWKYPALNYLCRAVSPFVPVRTKIKPLRWSRELMLCGYGTKPANEEKGE